MNSLQDWIKYIALAIIVFFLVKAFANDKLDNKQIILLVVLIMLIALFLMGWKKCPTRSDDYREFYQITNPPVVPSIYPGPEPGRMPSEPNQQVPACNFDYVNQDIEDMKSIVPINKKVYKELVENENRAMKKIRSKYKDEMVYTTTHPFNTIPLGTQIYGYTYLPPENWFRAYERPPICATDRQCSVCPITDGKTGDLMQFDTNDNVLGPAGINLDYIRKVVNKGETCS